jgi:hypothetical protein
MRTLPSLAVVAALTTLAACSPSQAAPKNVLVPGNLGEADYLTAVGGYVYWARFDLGVSETWSIERVAEAGGAVEVLAKDVAPPNGLAVDGTNAYWTATDGTLRALPVSGAATGAAPTVIASNLPGPSSLIVVGGAAYVEEVTAPGEVLLQRIPLDGSAPTTVASGLMTNLTSDGTAAYFVEDGAGGATCPGLGLTTTVLRYQAGDTAPTTLLSCQLVTSIAANGANLYAVVGESASTADRLVSVPVSGGARSRSPRRIPSVT